MTTPMKLELHNQEQAWAMFAQLLRLTPETVEWLRSLPAANVEQLARILAYAGTGRDFHESRGGA